ncbi:acyltransferase [Stenotrophomonas sp. HITSZ_GD]|uniref:acyltransferase n=1 Tax=Stenotrophomonas sp. HITSZ_GD TaxID=3037248 RepID=UPI00240DCDBD|nr:acyltransferase [Stenotrophomonas sp. HITSZ_GD]MDG2526531.1 acyltransferase [Stenotrophomonas sp. HITSZ_GD]
MTQTATPPDAALHDVTDARGNRLVAPAALLPRLTVHFRASHCLLWLDPSARIGTLTIEFNGDHGQCRLGAAGAEGSFSGLLRVGQDSRILVDDHTTATARCFICASEGTQVRIGRDCMLASDVQLRCDDAHPIFDIHTGERVNPSEDIVIGDHVWLAYGTRCMGGTRIGDGSVIGLDSIVTGPIPNNCVAVGRPARVTRRDIAWERPHLSHPPARLHADSVTRSPWWHPTRD